MADLNSTDLLLVNRNDTTQKVTQGNLMAELLDTDYMVLQRNDATYKITGLDLKNSVVDELEVTVQLSDTQPYVDMNITAFAAISGGKEPFTTTYQWKLKSSGGVESDIAGATSSTYAPLESQIGSNLACAASVTDSLGATASGQSNWSLPIASLYEPPIINTALLSENNPQGARYTSESFTVALSMYSDGVPTSDKLLKPYVTGGISKWGVTSPITGVTNSFTNYAAETNGSYNTADQTPDKAFNGLLVEPAWYCDISESYGWNTTTPIVCTKFEAYVAGQLAYLNSVQINGNNVPQPAGPGSGNWLDWTAYCTDNGDGTVSFNSLSATRSGSTGFMAFRINGDTLLIDGQGPTTLDLTDDTDLVFFQPGDPVLGDLSVKKIQAPFQVSSTENFAADGASLTWRNDANPPLSDAPANNYGITKVMAVTSMTQPGTYHPITGFVDNQDWSYDLVFYWNGSTSGLNGRLIGYASGSQGTDVYVDSSGSDATINLKGGLKTAAMGSSAGWFHLRVCNQGDWYLNGISQGAALANNTDYDVITEVGVIGGATNSATDVSAGAGISYALYTLYPGNIGAPAADISALWEDPPMSIVGNVVSIAPAVPQMVVQGGDWQVGEVVRNAVERPDLVNLSTSNITDNSPLTTPDYSLTVSASNGYADNRGPDKWFDGNTQATGGATYCQTDQTGGWIQWDWDASYGDPIDTASQVVAVFCAQTSDQITVFGSAGSSTITASNNSTGNVLPNVGILASIRVQNPTGQGGSTGIVVDGTTLVEGHAVPTLTFVDDTNLIGFPPGTNIKQNAPVTPITSQVQTVTNINAPDYSTAGTISNIEGTQGIANINKAFNGNPADYCNKSYGGGETQGISRYTFPNPIPFEKLEASCFSYSSSSTYWLSFNGGPPIRGGTSITQIIREDFTAETPGSELQYFEIGQNGSGNYTGVAAIYVNGRALIDSEAYTEITFSDSTQLDNFEPNDEVFATLAPGETLAELEQLSFATNSGGAWCTNTSPEITGYPKAKDLLMEYGPWFNDLPVENIALNWGGFCNQGSSGAYGHSPLTITYKNAVPGATYSILLNTYTTGGADIKMRMTGDGAWSNGQQDVTIFTKDRLQTTSTQYDFTTSSDAGQLVVSQITGGSYWIVRGWLGFKGPNSTVISVNKGGSSMVTTPLAVDPGGTVTGETINGVGICEGVDISVPSMTVSERTISNLFKSIDFNSNWDAVPFVVMNTINVPALSGANSQFCFDKNLLTDRLTLTKSEGGNFFYIYSTNSSTGQITTTVSLPTSETTQLVFEPDGTATANGVPITTDQYVRIWRTSTVSTDTFNYDVSYGDIVGPPRFAVGSQVLTSELVPNPETRMYCITAPNGQILDLSTADPGYVTMDSQSTSQVLTFPATFPTGETPDNEMPPGTSITVDVKCQNSEGFSEKTTNIVTPQ